MHGVIPPRPTSQLCKEETLLVLTGVLKATSFCTKGQIYLFNDAVNNWRIHFLMLGRQMNYEGFGGNRSHSPQATKDMNEKSQDS
jgi:hypothetical protein